MFTFMNQQLISSINSKPANPDGDGFSGTSPSKECQDNAIKFISALPKYYQEILKPSVHITPQPNGAITIDWYYMKQFVSVEIGDSKIGFFTDFNDGINPEGNGDFESIRDVVVAALNKLYNRKDI